MSQECNGVEVPVTGIKLCIDPSALECDCGGGTGTGGGIDYSLEEQYTGKKWINGKKIYQKTFEFPDMLPPRHIDLPHGIENLDKIIDMAGSAFIDPWHITLPRPNIDDPRASLLLGCSSTDIRVITNWPTITHKLTNIIVTILYTCTDR